jgi:hypothetical protein
VSSSNRRSPIQWRALVPGGHRVISNLKSWLQGTHHGVGADHLDNYLDEYVFRFNRRFHKMAGFETLLGLSASQAPTAWEDLRGPLPEDESPRRRGKATGLTRLPPTARPAVGLAQPEGSSEVRT